MLKWDAEVDSLHIKRISIEDLVGYVYIDRVNLCDLIKGFFLHVTMPHQHPSNITCHIILDIKFF
jgi:hypothetical protein